MSKAVILVGGPHKGTRFRPLSLELPKPLVPIAGVAMVQHQIDACSRVPGLSEVLIIGFYPETAFSSFISSMQAKYHISIKYLREYEALGTAGGLYHFRDQILKGSPEHFFVLHSDICSNFPLESILASHKSFNSGTGHFTATGKWASAEVARHCGQIVYNEKSSEIMHYAEKPESHVSDFINCGIYIFTPKLFKYIGDVFLRRHSGSFSDLLLDGMATRDIIMLERDVLRELAGSGVLFIHTMGPKDFWMQIKTAGSALRASRLYLTQYEQQNRALGTTVDSALEVPCCTGNSGPKIVGNVWIHPTASVDSSAKLGPNVVVGPGARISSGVRLRECIILDNVQLKEHCCVSFSIIGWSSVVGPWARVEGDSNDVDEAGVTILGEDVRVAPEIMVSRCISLPHKDIRKTTKMEILL